MFNAYMMTQKEQLALEALRQGGGMLYPLRNGYEEMAQILDALAPDYWRSDESVLGGLVLYLLKQGQTGRAKSYLRARNLRFKKTFQFEVVDLLLALHLGETVSERKLTAWRRLERKLPLTDPLLLGLYYNSMMAMFVRIGKIDEGRVAGQQAISCYREAGHVYLEHFIHIHLADIDVLEGRLRRALRGLATAERCLAQSGETYGNEVEVIEVIRLAVAYERGEFERVCSRASRLRTSLLNGDSWSELFFQLARIAILSTYFSQGLRAALLELEVFQADYVRRHAGRATTIEALAAMIWWLEWNPNETEQSLDTLLGVPMHSALGESLLGELQATMSLVDPAPPQSPRALIVAEIQEAKSGQGKARTAALERAAKLAFKEGHVAPFLEHRDVFLGVTGQVRSAQSLRGNRHLSRMVNQITKRVEESYVIPEALRELGLNRRQYRVTVALASGATNKQVARQLGTSEATVKYHLTSLYRLVGAKSRFQFIDLITEIENNINY